MKADFDVAVIGLGAHGSAAAYHLAKEGVKVLGIDRFRPPHIFGSSHGQSRIIREAYLENPVYVPLVQNAYQCWYELEKASGKQLLLPTGGLMLGNGESSPVKGSKLSADMHNIPYEYLNANDIRQRFPVFRPTEETCAVYEKRAGILFPEECIQTHLEQAEAQGAVLHYHEQVIKINSSNAIVTDKGTYTAEKIIITAGAWLNDLMPELHLPLQVQRQVLFWINCRPITGFANDDFLPGSMPVYIWEFAPHHIFYGFPDLGDGIKIAIHQRGQITTADTINRHVSKQEVTAMAAIVQQFFNVEITFNYSATCMYTNTPDEDFILDYHPANKNIIIASPCSGHGFKFSSAIGKILGQMATAQPLLNDITPFSLKRFSPQVAFV